MLKAARLSTSTSSRVSKEEADFDNSCGTRSHQGISKDGVNHGAQWKILRMGTHPPAGHDDHECRDDISPWFTASAATQPNAQKTCTPPYNSHTSVLEIILDPRAAPTVLGESIHATPCGDHQAVKELLTSPGVPQPDLAHK